VAVTLLTLPVGCALQKEEEAMQVKITATRWRPGLTAPLWSALAPWAPALAVLRLPGNEVLCFSWHTFSILNLSCLGGGACGSAPEWQRGAVLSITRYLSRLAIHQNNNQATVLGVLRQAGSEVLNLEMPFHCPPLLCAQSLMAASSRKDLKDNIMTPPI